MSLLKHTKKLSNDVNIPVIGFGTWQIENGEEAYQSVTLALKHGYIHIDTANGYANEESVGRAIKDADIPRKNLFVTSKLPSHIKTYEEAKQSFEDTLSNLGFEYIDLYLIHAPWPWNDIGSDYAKGNIEAWKAMEELYEAGKIKAIGVSNFSPSDIDNIINNTSIKPHVNQIAYYIGHDQQETLDYCKANNIVVEAYSPLATGHIFKNDNIKAMAKKYNVSTAQLAIRYCLEKDTIPLPKSTHEARIIENSEVDFTISKEDIKKLEQEKDVR